MQAFIVLFALVAAVSAQVSLYAGIPAAYGAYDIATTPFKSAPCVNAANVPVPCAAPSLGYAGLGALYGRKKREAEAQILGYAGAPYAYGIPYSHPSNYGVCTNYIGVQVPC